MSWAACPTLVHLAGATASHLMLLPDANSAQAITITSRPTQTAHQSSVEKSPPPWAPCRFAGFTPAGRVGLVSLIAMPREKLRCIGAQLLEFCLICADPAKYRRAAP